jgi:hypothetical protein
MRLVKPKTLELVGIIQLSSLKAKETLLHYFVLLQHKDNGKLLLKLMRQQARFITME